MYLYRLCWAVGWLIFFPLYFLSSKSIAQTPELSSISGLVKSPDGDPLPGAVIQVEHLDHSKVYEIFANLNGTFQINQLQPGGPYRLHISFVGFEDHQVFPLYLEMGAEYYLPIVLSETDTEIVSIDDQEYRTPLVDIRAQTGKFVANSQLRLDLPDRSQNPLATLRLAPGIYSLSPENIANTYFLSQGGGSHFIDVGGLPIHDYFGVDFQQSGPLPGLSHPFSKEFIEQSLRLEAPYGAEGGTFQGGRFSLYPREGLPNWKASFYSYLQDKKLRQTGPNSLLHFAGPNLANTFGASLAGPLQAKKLYFRLHWEHQELDESLTLNSPESSPLGQNAQTLRNFLLNTYNFDPGEPFQSKAQGQRDRFMSNLVWYVNPNNRLHIRYAFQEEDRMANPLNRADRLLFSRSAAQNRRRDDIFNLQLSSSLGDRLSSQIYIGFRRMQDQPESQSLLFPSILVQDSSLRLGTGSQTFAFQVGNPEPLQQQNIRQRVWTIGLYLKRELEKHKVSMGLQFNYYAFRWVDGQNFFGSYVYGSLNDFLNQDQAISYTRYFNPELPFALSNTIEFTGNEWFAFIQDEFWASERLKLQGSFRLDFFRLPDASTGPSDFQNTTQPLVEQFFSLQGAAPGLAPRTRPYFSPRMAWTWGLDPNFRRVLKGGIGIFRGRLPYGFWANLYRFNGLNRQKLQANTLANGAPLPLQNPAGQIGPDQLSPDAQTNQLVLWDRDFRIPAVFRTSLELQQYLKQGSILSVQLNYSRNHQAVDYQQVGYRPAEQFIANGGEFRNLRPRENPLDPRYSDIIWVSNTNRGQAFQASLSWEKPLHNNWQVRFNYTYALGTELSPMYSVNPLENWERQAIAQDKGLDNPGFSPAYGGHQGTVWLSYQKQWSENVKTSLHGLYRGLPGAHITYTVANTAGQWNPGTEDINLLYIPRNFQESGLVDDGPNSALTQWGQLNRFIESDPYLRDRRGEFVRPNGKRSPYVHRVDLRFVQSLRFQTGRVEHLLDISIDIFNFQSLFNENWGKVYRFSANGLDNRLPLLRVVSTQAQADGSFKANYVYRGGASFRSLLREFEDPMASLWSLQIGIRYSFEFL